MIPKTSTLAVNIFRLYGSQDLNYPTPALMLPCLGRVLGVEQCGLIAFPQEFARYSTIATDYESNFSAARAIAGALTTSLFPAKGESFNG